MNTRILNLRLAILELTVADLENFAESTITELVRVAGSCSEILDLAENERGEVASE